MDNSPDNQQGVREALALTPESYVFDFIRQGETNGLRLEPWEQAYQDAGLIEKAEKLGYIYIARNVACDITVTAHGRTAAKLHAALKDAILSALSEGPDYKSLYAAEMNRATELTLEVDRLQKLVDAKTGKLSDGIAAGLRACGVDE